MWTGLFDRALPTALFEHTSRHVIEHPRITALYEHSFWFPLGARPRLYIEHAISSLRRLLPAVDGLAGAEWWVPALSARQGMEWHSDCDRIIYGRDRRFVRPVISSVLYLGTVGGPTLVVDEMAADHGPRRPRPDRGGIGFLPVPNRYGLFPGDRLHAVAIAEDAALRVTVAVNWWAAKPSAPLCVDPCYESEALAPMVAPDDLELPSDAATRPVAPLQVSAREMAALPHRGCCPIYPRPSGLVERG